MPRPCRLSFSGWKILLTGLLLFSTISFCRVQAARNVVLSWDANTEPDIIGYRLRYGTSSRKYTFVVDVGPATTGTIVGIEAGVPYFIAVTAYNSAGVESGPSDEVSFEYPRNTLSRINMVTPGAAAQFNEGTEIQLRADVFDDDSIARVEFFDGAMKVGETVEKPFSVVWRGASNGVHTIVAVAYDANGGTVRSTEVPITVTSFQMSLGERLPDGSFQLIVSGAIGRTNRIYVSSDLSKWTLLTTVENTEGTLHILDPDAAGKDRRFYRVVAD